MGPCRPHSTYEVVSGSPWRPDNGKSVGIMAKFECLYTNRGVLSGPPVLYMIGDQKMEGKYLVKTWSTILVEIFHPESPQINLGQGDLRGKWGRNIQREREMRFWFKEEYWASVEHWEIVWGSSGYLTLGKQEHTCLRLFTPSWPDIRNVSITITIPHWKIVVKAPDWHYYLLKWHDEGNQCKRQ